MFRQSHPLPTVRFSLPSIRALLISLNEDLDKSVQAVSLHYALAREYSPHWMLSDGRQVTLVEKCILYMEDRRFYLHSGVSFRSLIRGAVRPIVKKKFGAVSTIDQQVVRLIVGRSERTLSRKLRELMLALSLNTHVNKAEILSYYLGNAYCGYKLEGIDAAAMEIFGVPAASLDEDRSAFLACLLALPMPKVVYEALRCGDLDFGASIKHALLQSHLIAPRWSRRISWRYHVALEFTSFKPKRR